MTTATIFKGRSTTGLIVLAVLALLAVAGLIVFSGLAAAYPTVRRATRVDAAGVLRG